ncbi:hypothetical protein RUM43_006691 [Polyplax serrata]|uniref:Secreted protein n=1 Tax=Polyplax serrata TaxID=468196 RepID=A0AAN8S424_POLSC
MHLVPRMATALVFFICVSNDGSEQANAQYYSTGINSREMRMCGPMLTNTLELVCQGRFNTINKKAQGPDETLCPLMRPTLFAVEHETSWTNAAMSNPVQ